VARNGEGVPVAALAIVVVAMVVVAMVVVAMVVVRGGARKRETVP
jgi:hypothetical protein